MQELVIEIPQGRVSGYCAPGFSALADAFAENFRTRDEVGASFCVTLDGQKVVDLWGGWAQPDEQQPWRDDTVSIVFSNTKAACALCLHLLAERGQVELDGLVTAYWPEFGQNGKSGTTVRMLLDHTAGVPALREPLRADGVFDWDYMVTRLAAEAPFWNPGSRTGYHGLTFGWLVGEVVRRVSGVSLGEFFRREIAAPLGLDYWIGLPQEVEHRVAPIIVHRPGKDAPANAFERALADKTSIAAQYFFNTGGWRPSGFNSRQGRAAQIPAANGVTNARGLAGFYTPLACDGEHAGGRLASVATIDRMSRVSSATNEDATLQVPTRFAAGFMRSMDNRARGLNGAVLGRQAFGHVGAGGSLGFADPQHRLGFGYTMNRMGAGTLLNERAQSLVDATYRILGESL